jgi:hypothetical protein
MPSKARKLFDANVQDIQRLLDLHLQAGGSGVGRRHGLEVLNKAAIVLITAYWEAYCEDLATEALAHLVENAKSSAVLPKRFRRQIADDLKKAEHELEVWKIADDGWKRYVKDRLEDFKGKRNWDFNTPKTEPINVLFMHAIGIERISASWKWPKKMTVNRATQKLDKYVSLRGDIAHRGKGLTTVKKFQVSDFFKFIQKLAAKTDNTADAHIQRITGRPL